MILIDDREPQELVYCIQQHCPVEQRRISVGDFLIGDEVIERKTVTDLIHSLEDNRFWNQLTVLQATYPRAFLLVEGRIFPKLYGPLNYASSRLGIKLLFSEGHTHTATILSCLHTLKGKPAPRVLFPAQCKTAPPQLGILSQFPGVGWKTARTLLYTYGSLWKVLSAKPTDLKKTLGKKTLAKVLKTLYSPWPM
ncbi:hypothetical protein HY490_05890 [Candidatus Woesearchaeota archaeon]|nr:hypothetical protein [Candidatus Woesearchaeota archaeon]